MAGPDLALERRALLASIGVTAVLAAIGVVWGVASGSQMILLDGVYGMIGIVVSWLLLRASMLAGRAPSKRYPFGREAVTPLVIGVQGFVLLATLAYAAAEAAFTIRAGGSDVTAGWGIVYGVITTAGSLGTWWWVRRRAGGSDLLTSEATAWRIAALRGVGMIVGFSVLAVLVAAERDRAAAYVDPTMVLVTCAAFLPAPIGLVRATFVELLEGAPADSVQSPVRAAVDDVVAAYDLRRPELRMTKLGPKLYVEVDGLAAPDVTIARQAQLRRDLQDRLDVLPYEIWLNVELSPVGPTAPGEPTS